MAKKDTKVEEVVKEEPVVEEPKKEVKVIKDSQGGQWELDDNGNRVKRVY